MGNHEQKGFDGIWIWWYTCRYSVLIICVSGIKTHRIEVLNMNRGWDCWCFIGKLHDISNKYPTIQHNIPNNLYSIVSRVCKVQYDSSCVPGTSLTDSKTYQTNPTCVDGLSRFKPINKHQTNNLGPSSCWRMNKCGPFGTSKQWCCCHESSTKSWLVRYTGCSCKGSFIKLRNCGALASKWHNFSLHLSTSTWFSHDHTVRPKDGYRFESSAPPRAISVQTSSGSQQRVNHQAASAEHVLSGYLPSGKRLHNYGKIHHFEWVNPLFLWSCSIAMLVYQRVVRIGKWPRNIHLGLRPTYTVDYAGKH